MKISRGEKAGEGGSRSEERGVLQDLWVIWGIEE